MLIYSGGERYQDVGSTEYYIDEETIKIEDTVIPVDDNNTLNLINSLYNDLNDDLKFKYFFIFSQLFHS